MCHLFQSAVAPRQLARVHLPYHNPKAVEVNAEADGVSLQNLWALGVVLRQCLQISTKKLGVQESEYVVSEYIREEEVCFD